MGYGPLYQNDYVPQFSGHETFPLRYGWLKKVVDRIESVQSENNQKLACWGDAAIAKFGVGKNMVASMRHWGKATGMIVEESAASPSVKMTKLGRLLFSSPEALDPYLEHPSTLWLLHWQLAANKEKTTWFWVFGHYPAVTFDRDGLCKKMRGLINERAWPRTSDSTIKSDVACFIRTYAARQTSGKAGHDDALESPLTELGLIRSIGKTDGFRLARGPKSTLGDGVFTYALIDFWRSLENGASTLSFEAIAHAPGSPGRVFLLDENDVADRLSVLEDYTKGAFRWSETAGLKQVVRSVELTEQSMLDRLRTELAEFAYRKAA